MLLVSIYLPILLILANIKIVLLQIIMQYYYILSSFFDDVFDFDGVLGAPFTIFFKLLNV